MRWEDLFADLEQQWDALAEGDRQAEIAERTRAEFAQVDLVDRLRGSEGRAVRLRTKAGQELAGDLSRVGADFVLMSLPRQECVLPFSALATVHGLGPESVSVEVAGPVRTRLGLGSVLRRIAADRSPVTLVTAAGMLSGTVQRVGSDFLELAEHAAGDAVRATHARRPTLVPFSAVDVIRRESAAAGY